jgi:hypothetical protein
MRVRVRTGPPVRAGRAEPERVSSERARPRNVLRVGAFTGGSFGARLRSRVPQYGHSVTYGLTSEPHCLHTTNRSAPEVIANPF